jgi:hypothetical protein
MLGGMGIKSHCAAWPFLKYKYTKNIPYTFPNAARTAKSSCNPTLADKQATAVHTAVQPQKISP